MSKIFIIALSCVLASCGTMRPFEDEGVANATGGVRTMQTTVWWSSATAIEKSITKAKEECLSENKKFEYISHNIFLNVRVLYRCNKA